MWINPLDKMPQIPQDWANHISQGGIWTTFLIAPAFYFLSMGVAALGIFASVKTGLTVYESTLYGALVMTAVSVSKKLVDRIKEGESWPVCIGKAIVTVLWPWSLVAAQLPYLNH